MPNPLTNQTEKNIAKDNIITDIKNLFRLKKIIRDIKTLFESDEEGYYELVRISNAFDDNCIEYEGNDIKAKRYQLKNFWIRLTIFK